MPTEEIAVRDACSHAPTLAEIFWVCARVSALTIGGGFAMFPMFKAEAVDARGWITSDELVDYYALGQSVPGIIAINTSLLIGYRVRGVRGAGIAALGMATPSVIAILLIAILFARYLDHPVVQKAFAGVRAAVLGMIAMAVWNVGRRAASTPLRLAIAVGAFFSIIGLGWSPVVAIALGALAGWSFFGRGKAS